MIRIHVTGWTQVVDSSKFKTGTLDLKYHMNMNRAWFNGTELIRITGNNPSENEWNLHTDNIIYTHLGGTDPDDGIFEVAVFRTKP